MYIKTNNRTKLRINEQSNQTERYLNPSDIDLPPGYQIEVFAQGLDAPSCIEFTDEGELYISESGFITGRTDILRYNGKQFEVVADGFEAPVTGLCIRDGRIYVSQKGKITAIKPDGTKQNILTGLPCNGDHSITNIEFGLDNKMYFGLGTATNSGVVGLDNQWLLEYPMYHDNPGDYIMLNGQNFETENIFSTKQDAAYTGAFSPFGVPNMPFEVRKGIIKASGSILRANLDGSNLEMVAWGFRCPSFIKFDNSNRLFTTNQGYDVRGSRPIANAPDEFHLVQPGAWYGWPDYVGSDPVTESRFKPEGGTQPEFLITNHPGKPVNPFATFPSGSHIMGFDFCYNNFGTYGDVYIAESGGGMRRINNDITPFTGKGHRVSKIDMNTGGVTTFAINKSGFPSSITKEGGFGRPIDLTFGPDGAMYLLDLGTNSSMDPSNYFPGTGVIWRITKAG